ncbi:MAG: SelB C-terminal domain-containing protein, partial [Chloroflexi bacterium]|nr:SelB C-terminal domain-containing protein [Chloroflexota bacterium]
DRTVTDRAAAGRLELLVADGRLAREGDTVRPPGARHEGRSPALAAAMDRLVAALSVAGPPALSQAARATSCPPDGIRALERSNRIVRVGDDLAWDARTYRELSDRAIAMAATAPLTPAAYRDATGTSRKYVMAILEDLDRRAILRRTPAGHVPGPRAATAIAATAEPVPEPVR